MGHRAILCWLHRISFGFFSTTSPPHTQVGLEWGGHLLFCIRRASLCFASVLHLNLHHFVVPDRISEVFVLPKWLHSHNILESPHLQEKEGECFQQLNVKKKHEWMFGMQHSHLKATSAPPPHGVATFCFAFDVHHFVLPVCYISTCITSLCQIECQRYLCCQNGYTHTTF